MTTNPADNKIPIIALCGFLGAGKTTLLNHILSAQNGRKIAVIVNDFGSINVDSLLIASRTQDTVKMSNGSICCATGDDSIEEVVGRLAHAYSAIDMIIIEASGAAEPIHLIQSLSRIRNDYARFDSLLYVVDAYEYETTAKEHPELKEHIKSADCIILNKLDSVDEGKKTQLKETITTIAPSALIIESTYGKVDVEQLLGIVEDESRTNPVHEAVQLSLTASHDHHDDHHDNEHDHHDHSHIHDSLLSTTFASKRPMDPELLLQFFDNPPRGLYRLKGWIDFGMKGMAYIFIVQLVASRWQMRVYKGNETFNGTELLLIGTDAMDEKAALTKLEQCIDQDPGNINKDTMVDIAKYDREYI